MGCGSSQVADTSPGPSSRLPVRQGSTQLTESDAGGGAHANSAVTMSVRNRNMLLSARYTRAPGSGATGVTSSRAGARSSAGASSGGAGGNMFSLDEHPPSHGSMGGVGGIDSDDDPLAGMSFAFAQVQLTPEEALLYGKMTPRPASVAQGVTAASILGLPLDAGYNPSQPLERRRLTAPVRRTSAAASTSADAVAASAGASSEGLDASVPLTPDQIAALDAFPENWTDPLLLMYPIHLEDVFTYYCHEPDGSALSVQDLKALAVDCYTRFIAIVYRIAGDKRRAYNDVEIVRYAYRQRCKKFPGSSHAEAVFCAFKYIYDSLVRRTPAGPRVPKDVFLQQFPRVHRDLFVYCEIDSTERADLVKSLARSLDVYKASGVGGSQVRRLEESLTSVRANRNTAPTLSRAGSSSNGGAGGGNMFNLQPPHAQMQAQHSGALQRRVTPATAGSTLLLTARSGTAAGRRRSVTAGGGNGGSRSSGGGGGGGRGSGGSKDRDIVDMILDGDSGDD